MDRIAAFIDGSDYAASICDHATWAAGRLGMGVTLVHVIGRRSETDSAPADLSGNLALGARTALMTKLAEHDRERASLARERGRAILDDAVARMRGQADIDVATKLRTGDLSEAIGEVERDSRFVILGKRGEGAEYAGEHLGSNLDRAIRTARRPVLVANRAFRTPERFLLAYDGSPAAERAVERLEAGSVLKGQACHILTVGQPTPKLRDALKSAAETIRGAGFDVTEHLEAGETEAVIARMVGETGADMLVLGKSGHTRLRSLFIGSTTMELMRSCKVPVVVFP